MTTEELLSQLYDRTLVGNKPAVLELTNAGLAMGLGPETLLYEALIPRLLRKEQQILSCLSAKERKDFANLLGKIEQSLDLVQTSKEADAKEAY